VRNASAEKFAQGNFKHLIDFLRHQAEFQGFAISALPSEKKQKIESNRATTRQSPKLIENQS